MNLSLVLFVPFLLLLGVLAAFRRSWLFMIMPLAMALPTTRTMIGPAPIYWYDCTILACLFVITHEGLWQRWPRRVPPWMMIFAAIFLIFGVLVPVFRYGFWVEIIWLYAHTVLAWSMFAVGLAVIFMGRATYASGLVKGIAIALALLAIVAVLERANVGRTLYFNHIFFADLRKDNSAGHILLERGLVLLWANRVVGPLGSPNAFAAFAASLATAALLLAGRQDRVWRSIAIGAAGLIVFACVSRQVLLGAVLGSVAYSFAAPIKSTVRNGLLAAGGLVAFGLAGAGVWAERLSNLASNGIYESNVQARLGSGIGRLIDLLLRRPDVLFAGAGLDVQKLAARGVDVSDLSSGFVSNSFLLPLYYLGLTGFIAVAALWIWSLRAAMQVHSTTRPMAIAAVVGGAVITFADNSVFIAATITGSVLLTLGLVAGHFAVAARSQPAAARPSWSNKGSPLRPQPTAGRRMTT